MFWLCAEKSVCQDVAIGESFVNIWKIRFCFLLEFFGLCMRIHFVDINKNLISRRSYALRKSPLTLSRHGKSMMNVVRVSVTFQGNLWNNMTYSDSNMNHAAQYHIIHQMPTTWSWYSPGSDASTVRCRFAYTVAMDRNVPKIGCEIACETIQLVGVEAWIKLVRESVWRSAGIGSTRGCNIVRITGRKTPCISPEGSVDIQVYRSEPVPVPRHFCLTKYTRNAFESWDEEKCVVCARCVDISCEVSYLMSLV